MSFGKLKQSTIVSSPLSHVVSDCTRSVEILACETPLRSASIFTTVEIMDLSPEFKLRAQTFGYCNWPEVLIAWQRASASPTRTTEYDVEFIKYTT